MNWNALFADSSFSVKLLLTVFFFVFGLLFSIVLMSIVYNLYDVATAFEIPFLRDNYIVVIRISQLLQCLFAFLLPAIVMAYLTSNDTRSFLSLRKAPGLTLTLFTVAFMLLAIPVINLLAELNAGVKFPEFLRWFEEWTRGQENARRLITEELLATSTLCGLLLNVLLIAFIPALCEEFFFRGLLQRFFLEKTHRVFVAVWLTAFIFSAIHIQFYGFVPRLLLGAYFGYLLVWSGSLWLPVIAHFVNNAAVVLLYFLYKNEYMSFNPEKFGVQETLFVSGINAALLVVVILIQRSKWDKAKNNG